MIPELSVVRLLRDTHLVAAGSIGTVMHAYADGCGYLVEFQRSSGDIALIPVDLRDVEAV